MGEPARKLHDIEPDIRPNLRGIDGGGQSTPGRAALQLAKQETNPEKPSNESLAEQESNGSNVTQGPWKSSVTGKGQGQSGSGGFVGAIKKKSPVAAIIITVVLGAIGIGGFSYPTMLMQSIYSNSILKFNIQETSGTLRTNRIISRKFSKDLADDLTTGSCGTIVNFRCKFTRPSNRFLTQLEKNGITAFDKSGNAISKNGLFPNTRPSSYKFISNSGDEVAMKAGDVYETMMQKPEIRDAFHKASKTRFATLTDSIFDKIKARFGFSNNNVLKEVSTDNIDEVDEAVANNADDAANNVDDVINSNVTIDDNNLTELAAERADDLALDADDVTAALDDTVDGPIINAIRTQLGDTLADAATQAAENGKGDAITLSASLICGFGDIPGMMTKGVRGFQMAQVIKYAAIFLATFGAMRAGEATAEEISSAGNLLTEVVDGKSAMDSFGVNNTINGDTIPQNNNFKKFVPAAGIIAVLGGFTVLMNSSLKKNVCATATNPATGAAINTALAVSGPETLGTSLLAAGLNISMGMALSEAVKLTAPWLIEKVMDVIPFDKWLPKIMEFFVGDLTKGLRGEEVGDALISGASHMMGQTGNAGGNMPLTVSEAIAYGKTTKEVQLAYAEEDRATKSPFDTSSPNTMMGSFVQKLIPYLSPSYRIAGSASNSIASILGIVTGSLGSVLRPIKASATSGEEYMLCDDPEMQDNDIAAGPYCNIIYGVPTEYLNKDPIAVVDELGSENIDEESGEPIPDSDLAKWMGMCTTGDTNQARNCKITDSKTANYALYTIDYRIIQSMDEEPTETSNSSIAGGSVDPGDSSQPENTTANGRGWKLTPGVDYSGVVCSEGTDDIGVFTTGPDRNIQIRLCQVPNTNMKVTSLISKRLVNMIKAAAADGMILTGGGFRTYEQQWTLRVGNCPDPVHSKASACTPHTAKAGYSMHEAGLAIDFRTPRDTLRSSDPEFRWMQQNAESYGFFNLPSESWHWSMSGG